MLILTMDKKEAVVGMLPVEVMRQLVAENRPFVMATLVTKFTGGHGVKMGFLESPSSTITGVQMQFKRQKVDSPDDIEMPTTTERANELFKKHTRT